MKLYRKFVLGLFALATFMMIGCADPNAVSIRKHFWLGDYYVKSPVPEAVEIDIPFNFGAYQEWGYRFDAFSLEQRVFKVSLQQHGVTLNYRGMPASFLSKDSTFNPPPMANAEAFVKYFLQWDSDYSFNTFEPLKGGSVISARYDSEKKFGIVNMVGLKGYRESVGAMLTANNNLFVVMASSFAGADLETYVVRAMKSISFEKN
jgi:hypothetical protein